MTRILTYNKRFFQRNEHEVLIGSISTFQQKSMVKKINGLSFASLKIFQPNQKLNRLNHSMVVTFLSTKAKIYKAYQ